MSRIRVTVTLKASKKFVFWGVLIFGVLKGQNVWLGKWGNFRKWQWIKH